MLKKLLTILTVVVCYANLQANEQCTVTQEALACNKCDRQPRGDNREMRPAPHASIFCDDCHKVEHLLSCKDCR